MDILITATPPQNLLLFEQYRPRAWDEVAGQDKAIKQIQVVARRGLGGRAFWLSGKSGTGKTTIARLIAAEIADEIFVQELDASKLTMAALTEIENEMMYTAWGKGGRAILINEAHGLRKDAIRQLLVFLERIPSHVVVIFTTTLQGQMDLFESSIDANPLLSRCIEIQLAQRDLAHPFAERAQTIAQQTNLDGKGLNDYVKLMQRCGNNLRKALEEIEKGAMLD